ncbi:LLM class flavin-dependent oxidoreductase [Roseomonas chloroacetimidivorans]|uniref:LLM class flavin-dependent oxidoreductase n=1 Tax=Roseomonas chloroacetimidivorans TaxID=1766656 RepID=UPI003C77DFF9
MRIFHFTEQPYPEAWNPEFESLRISLPNRHCDPVKAADLLHRYQDEWVLADELGLDIMVNEHHSTATCLSASASITLAILARITKRARLLALGVPLANRPDPLRVAEELAMIDVISRGRLEMGFVKGVPYEVAAANSNPVRMMDRLWEAHDLIIKAMTTHDGPFNFEGEYFHHRQVNIWPRPWQQPHPPVWITASSPQSVRAVAERGYVVGTFLGGYAATAGLYQEYRDSWRQAGHPGEAPADRFGYLAMVGIASSRAEAMRRAERVISYVRTTGQVAEPFRNPPGYMPVEANMQMMRAGPNAPRTMKTRSGKRISLYNATIEELMEAGVLFAGTPDDVFAQAADFVDAVGGLGNLLLMSQAGDMGHLDTVDSLNLIAREVLPRLREHCAKPRQGSIAA